MAMVTGTRWERQNRRNLRVLIGVTALVLGIGIGTAVRSCTEGQQELHLELLDLDWPDRVSAIRDLQGRF